MQAGTPQAIKRQGSLLFLRSPCPSGRIVVFLLTCGDTNKREYTVEVKFKGVQDDTGTIRHTEVKANNRLIVLHRWMASFPSKNDLIIK